MKLLIEFPYHPDRFHIESVEQRAALVEAFKNAKEATEAVYFDGFLFDHNQAKIRPIIANGKPVVLYSVEVKP